MLIASLKVNFPNFNYAPIIVAVQFPHWVRQNKWAQFNILCCLLVVWTARTLQVNWPLFIIFPVIWPCWASWIELLASSCVDHLANDCSPSTARYMVIFNILGLLLQPCWLIGVSFGPGHAPSVHGHKHSFTRVRFGCCSAWAQCSVNVCANALGHCKLNFEL